jgi:hypothetical protein
LPGSNYQWKISLEIRRIKTVTIIIFDMKGLAGTTILLFSFMFTHGQETIYLQSIGRSRLYYVSLNKSFAAVFKMGTYLDVGGNGYSLTLTDTLIKQSNDEYIGKTTKIVRKNNRFYLTTEPTKLKQFSLDTINDKSAVFQNLNNAFYLDTYFKMTDELNKKYPLNHYPFRNGFYSWKELKNKEVDPLRFRILATSSISKLKDSVSQLQDNYLALTNYLIVNLRSLEYQSLSDSLKKLQKEYRPYSWYFGSVVKETAKQKQEYFFRIAEDFPDQEALIFSAVEDDNKIVDNLREIEGHDATKKKFLKERRFNKTILYRVIGTYAILGGLVTWAILNQ